MRFYIEPDIQEDQIHPRCYRLHVSGPGRFHGLVGVINDAVLADLIARLLNENEKPPSAPPPGWKLGDTVPP